MVLRYIHSNMDHHKEWVLVVRDPHSQSWHRRDHTRHMQSLQGGSRLPNPGHAFVMVLELRAGTT
jgi:hypothetical protein